MTIKAPRVRVDPLREVIARSLAGIENGPREEARRLVSIAIDSAVAWYEEQKRERERMLDALREAESHIAGMATPEEGKGRAVLYSLREVIRRAEFDFYGGQHEHR